MHFEICVCILLLISDLFTLSCFWFFVATPACDTATIQRLDFCQLSSAAESHASVTDVVPVLSAVREFTDIFIGRRLYAALTISAGRGDLRAAVRG